MNLQPVQQSKFSETFQRLGIGNFELGRCVNVKSPQFGTCNAFVFDDGKGYADLDGTPFKAYYCAECASKLK